VFGAREHVGELFRRKAARFGERVGFCVSISRKLARVACREDHWRFGDRRIARDEKTPHAKGRRCRNTFRCLQERLAEVLDMLVVT
jgi:hypothetical protein